MKTETQTNIGRFARINVKFPSDETNRPTQVLVGNVLDLVAGTNEPKRIRVQYGDPNLKGLVVAPAQYDFVGWADEEEE